MSYRHTNSHQCSFLKILLVNNSSASPTAQTLALVTQLMLVIKLMVGINLVLIHSTLLARAACGQMSTGTLLPTWTIGPLRRMMTRTLTTYTRAPVYYIRRSGTIVRTALSSGAWQLTTNLLWYIIKLGTTRSNS